MPVLINGEPFIHGLDPDVDAATAGGTNPTTDALAHQQNTDRGTTKPFFELGILSAYANAGAIRRGLVFNSGGAGPITAFAWEARTADGTNTGRFVQCLNVLTGDPADINNVWTPAELALEEIAAGAYGANPKLTSFGQAIKYLLAQSAALTPPVIGGFNPAAGLVGDTVLINGNNFGVSTGNVTLNGKPCNVQGWSNYQISARVPAGATTGKFTVTTAGGTDISRDTFTVNAATVQTVPGAVSNFTAAPGNGFALLQWDAPVDNGNVAINDYEIKYRLAGATAWTTYAHSPRTVSNITVTGLTPGSPYEFIVAAKNPKGTGAVSAIATATPTSSGVVYNATTQSYTTTTADLELACGTGTTADPVTATSNDGVSTDSQTEANRIAKQRAKQLALSGIVCPLPGTVMQRNKYAVSKVKRLAVLTANVPALVETDITCYEQVFYDEVTRPGQIWRYACEASSQADGTSVWKWFRQRIS